MKTTIKRKFVQRMCTAALTLAAAVSAVSAAAGQFYVATTGSDSNPGTLAAPFKTLQAAVNAASAGSTIIVRDGTYGPTGGSGSMGVTINKAGTAGAPITLQAEHSGAAILDCQLTCHSYINFASGSAYWAVKGFDIRNGMWSGIFSNSMGAKNIVVQGNVIHNIGNRPDSSSIGIMGIYTDAGASGWTIDGNVFHHIGRTSGLTGTHDHGLYTHGSAMTITNNRFYALMNGWHIQTAVGFSGTIANNTFYGPDPVGNAGQVMLWDANSNLSIRNNIFYGSKGSAITTYALSVSGTCSIDHNLTYTAGASIPVFSSAPSGCKETNDLLNVDPKFVNAAAYDFTLAAGSPAAGLGAGASVVTPAPTPTPTPTPAPTAAVISNVSAAANASGATINWTTDKVSRSQVEYGLTASYGTLSPLSTVTGTSHSAALSGLAAGTLYHYRVKSQDDTTGLTGVSGDFTFTTTVPPPVVAAPTVSGVSAAATSSGASISWTTDKVSHSQVEYGLTSAYGTLSYQSAATGTSHNLVLSGLTAGTVYHYRVKSLDSATGLTGVSGDLTFTTTGGVVTPPPPPTPVVTAPAISGVSAAATSSGASISWTTDKISHSQVEYGLTSAYGTLSYLSNATGASHNLVLSGLKAGTVYHYRVKSLDSATGLTGVSGDLTLKTTGTATAAK